MQNRYDALLKNLYAGCTDREAMSEFLRALGAVTDSHVTTFVHADLENPDASSLLTMGAAPDEVLSWSQHAGENPWMQRYMPEIHAGGVCNGDAYVTHKELMASQYYDGFLRHIDTEHSLGICAAHQSKHAAFLMLCRSGRAGAYDDTCLELFQRLAPHVVNAFALQMQFEQLGAQASQMTRPQRGMFVLDAQWRWVGGNAAAEQMVAARWWRGRPMAALEPSHPVSRKLWKEVQRQLGQGGATPRVLPVYDATGTLVAFASLHVHAAAAIGVEASRYVLFVRPLQLADQAEMEVQLRRLFTLTTAEAVFAFALRRHGDAARAATAVGIAESSARTRLQSIFDKTGVHRQADLMLLMDALAETLT